MNSIREIEERTDGAIFMIEALIYAERQYAMGRWQNYTFQYSHEAKEKIKDAFPK